MKKDRLHGFGLAVLLLSMLLLTACGASAADTGGAGSDDLQQTEGTASQQEDATLEDQLGEDYVTYVTETITMQMGNRMEKDPEIVYFPIREDRPLTDYAAIDETTAFTVDEDGNIVITFPAGTVTDAAHGQQTFRLPQP